MALFFPLSLSAPCIAGVLTRLHSLTRGAGVDGPKSHDRKKPGNLSFSLFNLKELQNFRDTVKLLDRLLNVLSLILFIG
jgi:hypothetical protein